VHAEGMDPSVTKIIDNAIVGYVRTELDVRIAALILLEP